MLHCYVQQNAQVCTSPYTQIIHKYGAHSSNIMRNWKSLFMFKHCCCSHVLAAIFLSLAYLISVTLAATTTGYEVCPEKSRWSETSFMKGHISTSSLHHLPYIKAITWYFTYLSQLLVQTEAQVLVTVLFTQDYVKSGEASITILSCVSRLREVLVRRKKFSQATAM
jgi:hypothetical protein